MAKVRKPQVLTSEAPSSRYTLSPRRGFRVPTELKHLVIAWLALGVAFTFRYMFRTPAIFPLMLSISLGTVGLGFILHELAHKFAANHYGYWAEFRLWPWGLMMALTFAFISGGTFIFAAPGATYIVPRSSGVSLTISKRHDAFISLAGPFTNLALAGIFFSLGGLDELLGSAWLMSLQQIGYQTNLWLAAFNLIPIGGMDGQKIISWGLPVWLAVTVPLWILVAFQFFI